MSKKLINEEASKQLLNNANNLKYTSLKYIEAKNLLNSRIHIITNDLIILSKHVNEKLQIFWACNKKNDLIKAIKKIILNDLSTNVNIEFIPPEFVEQLAEIGFKENSHFLDFWLKNISSIAFATGHNYIIRELGSNELAEASYVTKMCCGLSRGFEGSSFKAIKEWYENVNSKIFVAEINNNIVAVLLTNLYGFNSEKGTVVWIKELAVNPNYQSLGLARNLMYCGLNWGLANNAKRSFLSCDKQNHKAIALYEKLGYTRSSDLGQINMVYFIKKS
ncbi:GNAT family N-acetyltransferase [Clostridium sp. 'deep sea']|uniref:GNAT family N-acetyltransferase n=1 Tax=Clostridium sp. 'deep sea' TaxID=2779445 RepID=UPI0018967908|nr:GNAT family N-acetyltransferase [Clostridium sp. 'deep sea']QOR36475.1 GNAT family N-acetyltransferase [Clostridium sp. 'deep sea']